MQRQKMSHSICHFFIQTELQELFSQLDDVDTGYILLKDAVDALKALNPDIDENSKVKIVIDDHFSDGRETVNFNQFEQFIDQLEQVGWRKKPKV